MMEPRKYVYAALGAPIVVTRKTQQRLTDLRARLAEDARTVSKDLREQLDAWAEEGERLTNRLTEGKMIDEFAAKVDFDQVQEQVSRLRDQLEDLLATWRSSFRPAERRPEEAPKAEKPAAEKKAAEKKAPARKTPAAKKSPAKAPAKKTPAKKASAAGAAQDAPKPTGAAKAS